MTYEKRNDFIEQKIEGLFQYFSNFSDNIPSNVMTLRKTREDLDKVQKAIAQKRRNKTCHLDERVLEMMSP